MDAVATLGFVVEQRRLDAAAAAELRAVTHWAGLHLDLAPRPPLHRRRDRHPTPAVMHGALD